ncbi:fatty acid hydroxylase family protein, partial [Salmonella enterica subsp. enterica serovar Newport]|nr:fatty acid hydroxylase family protein [Salmonella enterica subsp. enterica serovar Newport]
RGFLSASMQQWPFFAAGFAMLLAPLIWKTRALRSLGSRVVAASIGTTLAVYHLNLLFAPLAFFLSGQVDALYAALGVPTLPASTWEGLPWWALALIAVAMNDFADYWAHRVLHMKWLWPIHAIHHSDAHLSGFTTYRVHFLEKSVMVATFTLLLTWLGFPPIALGAAAGLLILHNMYVHLAIDIDHGPFRLLLASPRYHSWHHADVPEYHGKNLANVMPLWDWLFGTYKEGGRCDARFGAAGVSPDDPV